MQKWRQSISRLWISVDAYMKLVRMLMCSKACVGRPMWWLLQAVTPGSISCSTFSLFWCSFLLGWFKLTMLRFHQRWKPRLFPGTKYEERKTVTFLRSIWSKARWLFRLDLGPSLYGPEDRHAVLAHEIAAGCCYCTNKQRASIPRERILNVIFFFFGLDFCSFNFFFHQPIKRFSFYK